MNNRKLNNIFKKHSIQDIKNNLKNPKFEGFTVRNGNNLFYSPTNQQVVESNEVQAKINGIYTQFGIGSGIKTLYEQVSRRFLGITRKQVQEFLQSQSNYQIGKSKLKQTNKKIYSSDIMKSWYLDLIDCNPIKTGNKGYKYIMTIVDGFSRYVFLTKLKNKDCINVVEGIESISNLYANNQYPKTLLSDNGFRDQYVADFCAEYDIKQIFSPTYTPVALVEATNYIVRSVLRHVFLKNGYLNFSDHLEEVMTNINDRSAQSTGKPRNVIVLEGRHKRELLSIAQKEKETVANKSANQSLDVGDRVRVSLNSLETDLRKKQKEGNSKYIVARFSLEVFTIVSKTHANNRFLKETYKIADEDGDVIVFYYNELQKIPDNTINNPRLNPATISKLNSSNTVTIPEPNVVQTRGRVNQNL